MQGKKRAGSAKKESKNWNRLKKSKFVGASNITGVVAKRAFGANGANSVVKISKTAYPVPDSLITKLKTSATVLLSTGASGALNSYRLYANSLNDPFGTAGVPQPRFFDQLMALYSTYVVYGCKVNIKILKKTGGTQDATVRVIGFPSSASSFPIASAYADANEFPKTIRFDMSSVGSANNNDPGQTILTDKAEKSTYFDISEFFGRDRQSICTETNFQGGASTDPATLMSYYIGIQGYEAAQTDTVLVEITMTQYAVFRNVQNVATST